MPRETLEQVMTKAQDEWLRVALQNQHDVYPLRKQVGARYGKRICDWMVRYGMLRDVSLPYQRDSMMEARPMTEWLVQPVEDSRLVDTRPALA